jgi:hypothetical protein
MQFLHQKFFTCPRSNVLPISPSLREFCNHNTDSLCSCCVAAFEANAFTLAFPTPLTL